MSRESADVCCLPLYDIGAKSRTKKRALRSHVPTHSRTQHTDVILALAAQWYIAGGVARWSLRPCSKEIRSPGGNTKVFDESLFTINRSRAICLLLQLIREIFLDLAELVAVPQRKLLFRMNANAVLEDSTRPESSRSQSKVSFL